MPNIAEQEHLQILIIEMQQTLKTLVDSTQETQLTCQKLQMDKETLLNYVANLDAKIPINNKGFHSYISGQFHLVSRFVSWRKISFHSTIDLQSSIH